MLITVNDSKNNTANFTFKEIIQDTLVPTISQYYNKTWEWNEQFNYSINATDEYGLWNVSVNDTTQFGVNNSGWLINNTALDLGTYDVLLTYNDTQNNYGLL